MNENKMFEYARDLRDDLKYAFETGEGQTPDKKDVPVMNWLIERAKRVEELEKAKVDCAYWIRGLETERKEQERILKQQDKIINGLSDTNLMFFSKIVDYEKAFLAYGDSKGKNILKALKETEKFVEKFNNGEIN